MKMLELIAKVILLIERSLNVMESILNSSNRTNDATQKYTKPGNT